MSLAHPAIDTHWTTAAGAATAPSAGDFERFLLFLLRREGWCSMVADLRTGPVAEIRVTPARAITNSGLCGMLGNRDH